MREAFFRADFLLEPLFVIQYVRCFKLFWGSANVLLQVSLKMGKNEKNFESNLYFEAQKYYFVFELRLNFFFKWSYSQRCENRRWKWQRCFDVVLRCLIQRWKTQRCFNVVLRCKIQRWRTQRCFNVDLTLCDVATSYQPKKQHVEPTLKCLLGIFFTYYFLRDIDEGHLWLEDADNKLIMIILLLN